MFQIGHAEYSRIAENCGSMFKGDAVLAEVAGRFDLIPLELKLALIQFGTL